MARLVRLGVNVLSLGTIQGAVSRSIQSLMPYSSWCLVHQIRYTSSVVFALVCNSLSRIFETRFSTLARHQQLECLLFLVEPIILIYWRLKEEFACILHVLPGRL